MVLTDAPKKHIEKFRYYFKRTRQHRQITQAGLAKLMGYTSGQFISNIERGLSLVPVQDIPKICYHLETDPNEMYWFFVNSRTSHLLETFLRAKAKLRHSVSQSERKKAKLRSIEARFAAERRERFLANSTERRGIFLREYISFDEYLASIPWNGPDGFKIENETRKSKGNRAQAGQPRTDMQYEDPYEKLGRDPPFKKSD